MPVWQVETVHENGTRQTVRRYFRSTEIALDEFESEAKSFLNSPDAFLHDMHLLKNGEAVAGATRIDRQYGIPLLMRDGMTMWTCRSWTTHHYRHGEDKPWMIACPPR